MALTFAPVNDFLRAKRITDAEWNVADLSEQRALLDQLMAATRFIRRFTRRDFFPWVETQEYPIPYYYLDLGLRRRAAADIFLDADLLEGFTVTNELGTALVADTEYFFQELNLYPKELISIKWPQFWTGGGYATSTLTHVDQPAVTIAALWGYHDDYREAWPDTLEDVESGGFDISETSLTVVDATGSDENGLTPRIEVGSLLRVDNELMEVLVIPSATELTVKRGARGSTAAIHTAGVAIKKWQVIEDIQRACFQIAKTWREADQSKGGRQGVSDMSTGVELSVPGDARKILTHYVRPMQSNRR